MFLTIGKALYKPISIPTVKGQRDNIGGNYISKNVNV